MMYERVTTKKNSTAARSLMDPKVSSPFIQLLQMYRLQRNIGNFAMQSRAATDDHLTKLETGQALPIYARDFLNPVSAAIQAG